MPEPGQQAMRPEDVPDRLIGVAARAWLDAADHDQDVTRALLAAVLPVYRAQVERETRQHLPAVTAMVSGEWGVYCIACSDAAQNYVPRCLESADDWPPLVLKEAPHCELMEARAQAHEDARGGS